MLPAFWAKSPADVGNYLLSCVCPQPLPLLSCPLPSSFSLKTPTPLWAQPLLSFKISAATSSSSPFKFAFWFFVVVCCFPPLLCFINCRGWFLVYSCCFCCCPGRRLAFCCCCHRLLWLRFLVSARTRWPYGAEREAARCLHPYSRFQWLTSTRFRIWVAIWVRLRLAAVMGLSCEAFDFSVG